MNLPAFSRRRAGCHGDIAAAPEPTTIHEAAWQPAASACPVTGAPCALCDLPIGACARIESVSTPGAPSLARRLADLGFLPGAQIEVVRKAPLGDPVVYRVCDYELCLRKDQAAAVRVSVPAE